MKTWRPKFIFALIFLLGTAITARLVFLQIISGQLYRALAQGQQVLPTEISPERGDIFLQDKSGKLYPLATNYQMQYAFASPVEIENAEAIASGVSQILSVDKNKILGALNEKDSFYELLKSRISDEEAQKLKEASFKGVYVGSAKSRYFPQATSAAHLSGFVGAGGAGQYGIEGYYNNTLQSSPAGKFLTDVLKTGSEKGSNIILSIDYNIQFFAEMLLQKAVKDLEFEDATIIVVDPKTGRIFALANWPSFNPNEYFIQKDLSIFQDAAVQKLFEPGSAFKPFTMAVGLDTGKVTPDTKYTDPGRIQLGASYILNYAGRSYGEQTMTQVLEKSINTGAVFVERQVGNQVFIDYAKKFGFFEATDVDLAGEIYSENKTLRSGRDINFITASFGQGIEITPIQLVRAFSALVNGGSLVRPFVADKIMNADDSVAKTTQPLVGPRVISAETSNKLVQMLVSVVENGFGKSARIPGYYIGGKTGTAQVSWAALGEARSGYSDKTIQSFVGFAPAFDPRFIILVKLNNPKAKTAEYSAAPIFRDLAKYIIDYWEIPPDYDVNAKPQQSSQQF